MEQLDFEVEFPMDLVPKSEIERLLDRIDYWIEHRVASTKILGFDGPYCEELVVVEFCHRVHGIFIPIEERPATTRLLMEKMEALRETVSVKENIALVGRVMTWVVEHYEV